MRKILYLVGGAARSGKSTVAQAFLQTMRISWFCLDILMMGFARGLPASGVDPNDDELAVADVLWPVVRSMAETLLENRVNYLIEGVQLRPQHVWALSQRFGDAVRPCFIGYADVDIAGKFVEIRRYGGTPDDWLYELDDQSVLRELKRQKRLSAYLKEECGQYKIPYFENSANRDDAVAAVLAYLTG